MISATSMSIYAFSFPFFSSSHWGMKGAQFQDGQKEDDLPKILVGWITQWIETRNGN